MMGQNFVQLQTHANLGQARKAKDGRVLLMKPPFFTPWAPPLGIAILKSHLEKEGYAVRCFDYNTDSILWGTHHKYFTALQSLENVSINDGYSKLWWIFNAHMLAYVNGADDAGCAMLLDKIVPLYGMRLNKEIRGALLGLVRTYFNRLAEVTDRLDLSDVTVAGTSTYTTSLSSSLFILRRIKQKRPGVLSVMGGGVFADDLALGSDNLETLLQEYDFIDHVVLGEGEVLFHKLLEGEITSRVLSIADVKGATLNMKEVPVPDFSDLMAEHYYHLTIEGARSCPFQCSFCSETIQWGDYRKKPADLFADQLIGMAERFKNNEFFLGDSLMNPYIFQLSNELLQRKANILYDGYLRADKPVMNREKVKLWARSGCYRVRLGIESAAARVLEAMDKMTTPQVISEALKSLANAGIRTTTYWIVGFPGETEDDFQETVEFVRQHHRYIYEMEAHPYYYYPYGQVGSRLYQCYSIYPEEVTALTKFKVWEVCDVEPTREERYSRLYRLSKLASDLGLPNIYTMAERYDAEERWQRLYPLVTEVYQGTLQRRPQVQPPARPVAAAAAATDADSAGGASQAHCYHAKVRRRLDEKLLLETIDHLFALNEMLQVRLEQGRYVPAGPGAYKREEVLHAYDLPADARADEFCATVAGELSRQVRPTPADAIRVALIHGPENESHLLLVAHRAIADTRGLALLFEDLFRAYEQLAAGLEVSLTPVKKSYLSLLESAAAGAQAVRRTAESGEAAAAGEATAVRSLTVSLEGERAKRVTAHTDLQFGLAAADIFETALLAILARVSPEATVELTVDRRMTDPELERTAGPLTGLHEVTLDRLGESDLANPYKMRERLKEIVQAETSDAVRREDGAAQRVRLNLQYLAEQPWMGGDDWTPVGFLVDGRPSSASCLVEVVPAINGPVIEVRLWVRDDARAQQIAEGVRALLSESVESVLDRCDEYLLAAEYWREEFKKGAPQSNLEAIAEKQESPAGGKASVSCKVGRSDLQAAESACEADLRAVLLAAYAALLSRLNGREEVVILLAQTQGAHTATAPLHLYPDWNVSFKDFARQVGQKIAMGMKHGGHAFDVLRDRPALDVAALFCDSAAVPDLDEALEGTPAANADTELALEVATGGDALVVRLAFSRSHFRRGVVEKLASCLEAILESVAESPDTAIGEIALERENPVPNVAAAFAEDTFNF